MDQEIFTVASIIKTNSNVTKCFLKQLKKPFAFGVNMKTVWKIHHKWNLEGTVQDLNKGRSGRPLTARVPDNVVTDEKPPDKSPPVKS